MRMAATKVEDERRLGKISREKKERLLRIDDRDRIRSSGASEDPPSTDEGSREDQEEKRRKWQATVTWSCLLRTSLERQVPSLPQSRTRGAVDREGFLCTAVEALAHRKAQRDKQGSPEQYLQENLVITATPGNN